jgi:hypothetical protein
MRTPVRIHSGWNIHTIKGTTMAEQYEEAQKAVYDRIIAIAPKVSGTVGLLQLAEAFAWVSMPGQPHGGSATVSK